MPTMRVGVHVIPPRYSASKEVLRIPRTRMVEENLKGWATSLKLKPPSENLVENKLNPHVEPLATKSKRGIPCHCAERPTHAMTSLIRSRWGGTDFGVDL